MEGVRSIRLVYICLCPHMHSIANMPHLCRTSEILKVGTQYIEGAAPTHQGSLFG
jgi:hypothetical protein